MNDNTVVVPLLKQLQINPDSQLTKKAVNYLSLFPEDARIPEQLLKFLKSSVNLFAFQEAWLLKILKYSNKHVMKIKEYASKTYKNKRKHWYVRCQAVNILSNSIVRKNSFTKYIRLYENEYEPEVKRTLIKFLCQFDSITQQKALVKTIYDPYYKISELGKMLFLLRQNHEVALNEIRYIFREATERKLIDNFYKVGVVRFNKDKEVLNILRTNLMKILPIVRSKYLRIKVKTILGEIGPKQTTIYSHLFDTKLRLRDVP